MSKVISDEEFMKWAQSFKPCRYCDRKFVGPVCPYCESPLLTRSKKK